MVQRMKVEPASPDQRVPSQSNTAMLGFRAWTRAWNSVVVRIKRAPWVMVLVEQEGGGGSNRGGVNIVRTRVPESGSGAPGLVER